MNDLEKRAMEELKWSSEVIARSRKCDILAALDNLKLQDEIVPERNQSSEEAMILNQKPNLVSIEKSSSEAHGSPRSTAKVPHFVRILKRGEPPPARGQSIRKQQEEFLGGPLQPIRKQEEEFLGEFQEKLSLLYKNLEMKRAFDTSQLDPSDLMILQRSITKDIKRLNALLATAGNELQVIESTIKKKKCFLNVLQNDDDNDDIAVLKANVSELERSRTELLKTIDRHTPPN